MIRFCVKKPRCGIWDIGTIQKSKEIDFRDHSLKRIDFSGFRVRVQEPPGQTANEIRLETTQILLRAKPPPSNLSREEQQVLKEIRNNTNIVILLADKGNVLVIIIKSSTNRKSKTYWTQSHIQSSRKTRLEIIRLMKMPSIDKNTS